MRRRRLGFAAVARLVHTHPADAVSQPVMREEVMAMGRKLMWAVLGTAASKVARNMTRNAMYRKNGAPRLPRPVRRQRNLESALVMAVGTGVVMGIADMLSDQSKTAARVKPQTPHLSH